ncbi:2TM domain-containing protein [Kaistella sp.]|uniref:2TM domain-containing protein n=1 Tax=Kaistella sp. TaxID=2782235 RepID=UPI003C352914
MENLTEIQYQNAKNRVDALKKFYRNLFLFIIILGSISFYHFYKTGNVFTQNRVSFIFIIWGIILTIKAVKLFLLNSDWENNMIKKELKNQ